MRERIKPKGLGADAANADMTPMIDMTFQLIAFFMVLINFSEADQDQRIQLPESEMAKPPEEQVEFPITLQLTSKSTVVIGGEEVKFDTLGKILARERAVFSRKRDVTIDDALVIIRADMDAKTGEVQRLMMEAEIAGFRNFVLRAKEKIQP